MGVPVREGVREGVREVRVKCARVPRGCREGAARVRCGRVWMRARGVPVREVRVRRAKCARVP